MTKQLDNLMVAIQRDGRASLNANQVAALQREAAEVGFSPGDFNTWFRFTFPDAMFDVVRYEDPFTVEITRREAR